jgi:hypothetical protein
VSNDTYQKYAGKTMLVSVYAAGQEKFIGSGMTDTGVVNVITSSLILPAGGSTR